MNVFLLYKDFLYFGLVTLEHRCDNVLLFSWSEICLTSVKAKIYNRIKYIVNLT